MLRLANNADTHPTQTHEMNLVVLGERVRALRVKLKLTQKALAEKAGVTQNTLRGLERGTLRTRSGNVELVARALGLTPEVLERAVEPVTDEHPLLRDLSEEDLHVAQAFHHARTPTRLRIQRLLQGQADEGLALLDRIERLPVEDRRSLEGILGISEKKLGTASAPARATNGAGR